MYNEAYSYLAQQLGANASLKEVHTEQKMAPFLQKKISDFIEDKTDSDMPGSFNEKNVEMVSRANLENTQKVIVVTIACSDKMRERECIFHEIQDTFIYILDHLATVVKPDEVAFCFNIFTD